MVISGFFLSGSVVFYDMWVNGNNMNKRSIWKFVIQGKEIDYSDGIDWIVIIIGILIVGIMLWVFT